MLAAVGAGLAVAGRRPTAFPCPYTARGAGLHGAGIPPLAPTRRLWYPTGAACLSLAFVLWLKRVPPSTVLGAVAGVHLSLLDGL